MKKVLFVIGLTLITMSVNAQLFVGGNLSLNYESADYKVIYVPELDFSYEIEDYSDLTFVFNPKVGYMINNKFSAGITLIFQIKQISLKQTGPYPSFSSLYFPPIATKINASTFGIAPFARYNLLSFNKFNLGAEAMLGFTTSSYTYKISGDERPTQKYNGDKITNIGLSISPVVSYNLSNKISLETYLNFFNLSYSLQSVKPDGGERTNESKFSFGLTGDQLFTTGAVTVGAVYKF